MHLSTGNFECTVQEENLLSRRDTEEEYGQNLHQLRICQALGAMTTAPYYLPLFICIPSFPPTFIAGSHVAYFNVGLCPLWVENQ